MATIQEDYFTRAELAAFLGVCPRTVYRWEQRGEGPAITRIGMSPYYRKAGVTAWLEKREAAA